MRDDIRESLMSDLVCQTHYKPVDKDIIVVVYNQLEWVKRCLESIESHTKDYRLWLWDNASDGETQGYLSRFADGKDNVYLHRSETNLGFVDPNNTLAPMGTAPYLLLVNSDCLAACDGWDHALIAPLQQDPELGICGYMGGMLGSDGKCIRAVRGFDIDYVMGWGLCLRRETYVRYGLFDSAYQFAYFEDADLSLRLKKAGYKIYATHIESLVHAGNITANAVENEDYWKAIETFNKNQETFCNRWGYGD